MKTIDALHVAAGTVTTNAQRPTPSMVCDLPDARLLVFRIAPGQAVAPHRNASTVILTVLAGQGIVTGRDAEQVVSAGDVVVYEPNEVHGMHATDDELILLATIAPRPGSRASVAVTERNDAAAAHDAIRS